VARRPAGPHPDRLYLLGGLEGSALTPTGRAWVLSENRTSWQPIAPLPVGAERGAAAVIATADGIVVAGGANVSDALASVLVMAGARSRICRGRAATSRASPPTTSSSSIHSRSSVGESEHRNLTRGRVVEMRVCWRRVQPQSEDHMRTIILGFVLAVATAACGGGGGDDDGDDVAAPDASEAGPPTCADYCAAIATNGTGAVEQYTDEATCLAACAAYDVGTIDDMSGNTLGCRQYHAGAAATNATLHCPHAGPGGNDACGSNCEGFCTLQAATCTGANEQYADIAECMTECAGFDQTEPYDTSDTAGDTFACRLYHLTAAIANPGLHCPHIVEASAQCQ
jgi:hypothetical protein